jgi:hypothetical protein
VLGGSIKSRGAVFLNYVTKDQGRSSAIIAAFCAKGHSQTIDVGLPKAEASLFAAAL